MKIRFNKDNSIIINIILGVIFLFSLVYFARHLYDFSVNSLQVDFSAYYTAGEALREGYSPYKNNIGSSPIIWDGINITEHSRFLYPPIAAQLFQFITLIPYFYAKILWLLLSLLEIGLTLYITSKYFPLKSIQTYLICGVCIFLYFPLLVHLERGQIDTLTLLLLILAIYWMHKEQKNDFNAGVLIAFATLLKLHSIFLIPFLFIEKRWRVLIGFLSGMFILLTFSFLIPNPNTSLLDYITNELPRISNYGRADHGDIPLDPQIIESVLDNIPDGYTFKDGRIYQPTRISFVEHASLARLLYEKLTSKNILVSHTKLSMIVFSFLFCGILIWKYKTTTNKSQAVQFVYWLAILDVILISAPLTHIMNAVWLIPFILVILSSYENKHQYLAQFFLILGMFLVGIPEVIYQNLLILNVTEILPNKTLIGEFLILFGSLIFIKSHDIN